jgi:hypothetical protein
MPEYPYVWRWRVRLPERFGEACRIVESGSKHSCLVEFEEDGARFVVSRRALRRTKGPAAEPNKT